jgi:hypothetical protein
VLITPYIIEDDSDAQSVTDAFRKRLGGWAQNAIPQGNKANEQPGAEETSIPGLGRPILPSN